VARAPKAKGFGDWESPLDLDLPRSELGGMSLSQLAAIPFEQLGQFKQAQSGPLGITTRTFQDPQGSKRVGMIVEIPDFAASQECFGVQLGS
jgi:hypothetical protein